MLAIRAVCVTCVFAGLAQASQLCVHVTDPSGGAVANATVTVRGVSAPTGPDGKACHAAGQSGTAQVTVLHPDFVRLQRTVSLSAGDTEVHVELGIAPRAEHLTVTADAEPADESATVVALDTETLARLPVLGRDVSGVLTEWLDLGAMGTGDATVIMDGVEVPANSVKPALVEKVRVGGNPYSAEFSDPGRSRIEISTKSGATKLHGTVIGLVRDSALDARNLFALRKPDEHRRLFEASVVGPLTKRDSFLFAFSQEEESLQSIVNARTLSGEVRATVPMPAREAEWAAGWRRSVGESGALSLRYEHSSESALNRGVGGPRLPETGWHERERSQDVRGSWQCLLGGVLAELSGQYERSSEEAVSATQGLRRVVVEDAFTSGGAQNDWSEREHSTRFSGALTWTRGTHVLRAGMQLPRVERSSYRDRRDSLGAFRFSSLDEYARGVPYQYSVQSAGAEVAYWRVNQAGYLQDEWQVRPGTQVGLGLRWQWQNALRGRHDVAPRLSIVHAFGRTVVRAGAGLFHDSLGGGVIRSSVLLDGTRVRRLVALQPLYPEPERASALPPSLYRIDQGARSPWMVQASAGVERKWTERTATSLTYVRSVGRALLRSRDRNAPAGPGQARPNLDVGLLQVVEAAGRQSGHALEAATRTRVSKALSLSAQYRLASYRNDTDDDGYFPADARAPHLDWGRASFDTRHRVTLIAEGELKGVADAGAIFRAASGTPYTLTTGADDNGDGFTRDRPAGVPRNSLQAAGSATLDVRVSRRVSLVGGSKARFAVDAFNLLNRVNYSGFVGNLRSPFFGSPTSARSARRLQLSLQVSF